MKNSLVLVALFVVAISLFTVPAPAVAQMSTPVDVIQTIYQAVAADDIDGAMTLVADDVVAVFLPPPPDHDGVITGKEEMRKWFEGLKPNFNYTGVVFSDIQINGNQATWKALFYTDDFIELGFDAIEFEGSNNVQNGLLKQHTWIFTEEFQAKLAAANVLAVNRTASIQFMEELWDQGNLAVADEIIADNFLNHTPYPGLGTDREGLKADVAQFHTDFPDNSARFRIDDLMITEDKAVIHTTLMIKAPDSTSDTEIEGDSFVVILSMEDGRITERWLAWVTCRGQPVIAVCFGLDSSE